MDDPTKPTVGLQSRYTRPSSGSAPINCHSLWNLDRKAVEVPAETPVRPLGRWLGPQTLPVTTPGFFPGLTFAGSSRALPSWRVTNQTRSIGPCRYGANASSQDNRESACPAVCSLPPGFDKALAPWALLRSILLWRRHGPTARPAHAVAEGPRIGNGHKRQRCCREGLSRRAWLGFKLPRRPVPAIRSVI